MRTNERQRGYSLLELLIAFALLALLGGVATGIFASARRAHDQAVPEINRVARRSAIVAEIGSNARATANVLHFDMSATIAPLLGHSGATAAMGTETPSDGGGLPLGSGGGSGGGAAAPPLELGHVELPAVEGFGTGILVGERTVVGPLAVWDEAVWDGQEGPAVASLRVDPHVRGLHLAAAFTTTRGAIEFAAGDDEDAAVVAALRTGDLVLVNGSTPDKQAITAIAAITAAPVETTVESATPVHVRTFRATVSAADARLAWGLRNTTPACDGVTILADASVAVLDRDAPVAVYFTARGESRLQTPLKLLRVAGDPSLRPDPEELLDATAGALEASIRTAGEAPAKGEGATPLGVTIGVPLVNPNGGISTEPVFVSITSPIAERSGTVDASIWNVATASSGGGGGGGK